LLLTKYLTDKEFIV